MVLYDPVGIDRHNSQLNFDTGQLRRTSMRRTARRKKNNFFSAVTFFVAIRRYYIIKDTNKKKILITETVKRLTLKCQKLSCLYYVGNDLKHITKLSKCMLYFFRSVFSSVPLNIIHIRQMYSGKEYENRKL